MKLEKDLMKKPFWALSVEDCMMILKSSLLGLTNEDVDERVDIFGKNKIITKKRFIKTKIFLRQFSSPLIYILGIAGLVTLFLGDFNDAAFIFIAVAINTSLGFYQEYKAEKSLEGLSNYLEEKATVVRNGRVKEVNIEELVPGDIINFLSGDSVPADCRIVHSINLLVDESILTGESLPVEKSARAVGVSASLGDRKSMLFSGTAIAEGVATAMVVSIAKETELGGIASLITEIENGTTPLQKNINSLANKLGIVVIFLSLCVFLLGVYYEHTLLEMFTLAVAIAVAAVPEDLAIAMTVILSAGVSRLAKRNGVVRKLLSAETLGDTSVILTDKTGTLTESKLNLAGVEAPNIEDDLNLVMRQNAILKYAILATDARVENPEANIDDWKIVGKPLDSALIRGAAKSFQIDEETVRKGIVTVDRIPFNSENKFSAVKVKEGEKTKTIMIGAPEVILNLCKTFYWNGQRKISKDEKSDLLRGINKDASQGYRIISVAASDRDMRLDEIKDVDGFSYLGNILLKDRVRKDAGFVIKEIEKEGIKTVIVTGDHTGTAIAIAKELGMSIDQNSVIEQRELDLIDDDELEGRLRTIKIFSRVNPVSKVRIAKIFQKLGNVVAMTGDGVNDAPALKQADVGISIGSGSGVAREASDLVLLDDSFRTIVFAIDEGRRILQNIRKVVVFTLLDLFDELILVGGAILLNLPMPISAIQILWVNFITDSLPTISIAYEDEILDSEVIRKKISRKSIFDKEVKFLIWVIGLMTSLFLFALHVFLLEYGFAESIVKTFIFASFGIYTLLLIFSVKSLDKNIWEYNPFTNRFMNFSSVVGLLLMLLAVYAPTLQKLLNTVSLPTPWLIAAFGVSFLCQALVEVGKYIFINRIYKPKNTR